ncbi:MAG TPA: UDP-N-acetylmuramoyl-tripeptide--D-alanyl-D-alanine ligase, partial [Candidatus Eisenbacteria bacterium]
MTALSPWLTLEEVARVTGGSVAAPAPSGAAFAGCAIDSRSLRGGELFVPLPGTRADGHDFIAAALEAGAAGSLARRGWKGTGAAPAKPIVLVDDPLRALQALGGHCRERSGAPAVGVTGSNGKTTTKEMIAAVLGTTRRVHRNVGNLNNHIGVPLTLTWLRPEHQVLVIEMGMSARGEIRDLAAMVRPSIGVLTNASEAHLEQLRSVEEVARAKSELAEALPPDGLLVVNADDRLLWPMNRSRPVRKRSFALENAEADLRPTRLEVTAAGGTRFTLEDGTAFTLALLGRHNVRNALAAIAVGDELGVPRALAAEALAALRPAKHRLELIQARGLTVLDDAYNANPASMAAALALLGSIEARGARRAVLGDMLELGPASDALHEAVGRAVPPAAWLYAAGAFAAAIERGARAAGVPKARARRFDSVPAMAAAVVSDAAPGDLVLVKASRGMRLERVVDALVEGNAGAGRALAGGGRV